jgi:hypothetical protein
MVHRTKTTTKNLSKLSINTAKIAKSNGKAERANRTIATKVINRLNKEIQPTEAEIFSPVPVTPKTPKTPDIGYPLALAILGTSDEMELVADSGCSQSIINNNKHLINYSSTNIIFRTADHGILTCIGKGNLCLTNQLTVKNVLYCQEIVLNLISISQLCDQGFTVQTSKTVM